MTSSDVELMLRVRASQDSGAFEELMSRHKRSTLTLLMRMLNDLDTAHDLAEETFVRVWQAAPRYRPTARFTAWLYTIASRLASDHLRSARVRLVVSLESRTSIDQLALSETLADVLPRADQQVIRDQTVSLVRAAVETLPLEQRTALVLCEFENFSYADAAQAIGCTVKSVELRIYRAKQALREKLRCVI